MVSPKIVVEVSNLDGYGDSAPTQKASFGKAIDGTEHDLDPILSY